MAIPQVGVVSIRRNGSPIRLKGNVTYSVGGMMRESVLGPRGLIGFSKRGAAAFIEVETIDAGDLDLEDLQAAENETITLQLENGKTIVVNEASVVGQIQVNGEDGGITVRFEGPTGKEI